MDKKRPGYGHNSCAAEEGEEGDAKKPHLAQLQHALWCARTDIDAAAKSIGCYLLSRMNSGRWDGAFPSVPRIAQDTSFGRTTVIEATNALIATGLFKRVKRPGSRGSYTYSIHDVGIMLAEEAKWSKKLSTGTPRGPVRHADRSATQPGTSPPAEPVPVRHADTEQIRGTEHLTDQKEGSGAPLTATSHGAPSLSPCASRSSELEAAASPPSPSPSAHDASATARYRGGIVNKPLPDATTPHGTYVVKPEREQRKQGASGPVARSVTGKLSFANCAGEALRAELTKDFPGIALEAVLNKAAGKIGANTPVSDYPGIIRTYCQYAKDDAAKEAARKTTPRFDQQFDFSRTLKGDNN